LKTNRHNTHHRENGKKRAAQNLKPAKNTKPHHRGGTIRQFQPINKTIGINKLGTLLSSQTTEAFEYFLKQFILFRISSLRCLQLISFISTLQIRIFIRNSPVKVNPPSKIRAISIPSVQRRKNCFSMLGVGHRSAAAT